MNRSETALVLAKVQAFDQRTVGEADVLAWHEALGDLDQADALAAVTRHFRESTDRLMPAHVRRIVGEIDRERRRLARERREARAVEAAQTGRGPVENRSAEIAAFVARVRDVLSEGDPDKLRYNTRYWREQQRAFERAENAEPNPLYDPTRRVGEAP